MKTKTKKPRDRRIEVVVRGCVLKVEQSFADELRAIERGSVLREWNRNNLME